MMVNIFGTIIDTDRNVKPKLPYDNVGVQYGCRRFGAERIDAEQFVQLNERSAHTIRHELDRGSLRLRSCPPRVSGAT